MRRTSSKEPVVVRLPVAFKQPSTTVTIKQPPKDSAGPPADRTLGDTGSQRAMLHETFGRRLKIDEQRGFFLDGSSIEYQDLMKTAKQVRIENALPVDAKYWGHW